MCRYLLIFASLLLIVCSAKAQYQYIDLQQHKFKIEISTGYSSEDFSWSIAGNSQGQKPNEYSELIWQNQQGPTLNIGLRAKVYKQFFATFQATGKAINGGYVADTDYESDNRTNEVFYIKLNSHEGYTAVTYMAIGYQFNCSKGLYTDLSAGYSFNRQSLHLSNDETDDLNSIYKADWTGVVVQIKPVIGILPVLSLTGKVTYNQVNYKARANWNLIEEFEQPISFKHKANGYGIQAGLALAYKLSNLLSIQAGADYFKWSTGTGTDQLFLKNGRRPVTQLNGVNRSGYNLMAGIAIVL